MRWKMFPETEVAVSSGNWQLFTGWSKNGSLAHIQHRTCNICCLLHENTIKLNINLIYLDQNICSGLNVVLRYLRKLYLCGNNYMYNVYSTC